MSGVKISDLNSATQLNNEDIFAVVQNNETKKINTDSLIQSINEKLAITETANNIYVDNILRNTAIWEDINSNTFNKFEKTDSMGYAFYDNYRGHTSRYGNKIIALENYNNKFGDTYITLFSSDKNAIIEDEYITVSFYYMSLHLGDPVSSSSYIYFEERDENGARTNIIPTLLNIDFNSHGENWEKFTQTLKVPKGINAVSLRLGFRCTDYTWMAVDGPKIEKGKVATGWNANFKDIISLSQNSNNLFEFDGLGGLKNIYSTTPGTNTESIEVNGPNNSIINATALTAPSDQDALFKIGGIAKEKILYTVGMWMKSNTGAVANGSISINDNSIQYFSLGQEWAYVRYTTTNNKENSDLNIRLNKGSQVQICYPQLINNITISNSSWKENNNDWKRQIGGSNLLIGTQWFNAGWEGGSGTSRKINDISLFDGCAVQEQYYNWNFFCQTVEYEIGEVYTLSCYAKTDCTTQADLYFTVAEDKTACGRQMLTKEWKKYKFTFIANKSTGSLRVESYCSNWGNGHVYISKIKLEKGVVATDWCPHYLDYKYQLGNGINLFDMNKCKLTTDRIAFEVTDLELGKYYTLDMGNIEFDGTCIGIYDIDIDYVGNHGNQTQEILDFTTKLKGIHTFKITGNIEKTKKYNFVFWGGEINNKFKNSSKRIKLENGFIATGYNQLYQDDKAKMMLKSDSVYAPTSHDCNDFKKVDSSFWWDTGTSEFKNTPLGTLEMNSCRVFYVKNEGNEGRFIQTFHMMYPQWTNTTWTRCYSSDNGGVWSNWTSSFTQKNQISNGDDWDTFTDMGCYKVQGIDNSKNAPSTLNGVIYAYGILNVFNTTVKEEDRTLQVYYPHQADTNGNRIIYYRMYNSSEWTAWDTLGGDVYKKDLVFINNHPEKSIKTPTSSFANSDINHLTDIGGGDYDVSGNIIFSSANGSVNLVVDGDFYGLEGQVGVCKSIKGLKDSCYKLAKESEEYAKQIKSHGDTLNDLQHNWFSDCSNSLCINGFTSLKVYAEGVYYITGEAISELSQIDHSALSNGQKVYFIAETNTQISAIKFCQGALANCQVYTPRQKDFWITGRDNGDMIYTMQKIGGALRFHS